MSHLVASFLNSVRPRFWGCWLVLAIFCLPAVAFAQGTVIVALGDSNTSGYGVGPQAAFPARLETILRDSGYPVRVINAGEAGDTFGAILARVDSSVPPGARLVIVQGGYNDLESGVPPNVTVANLRAILSRLNARGAKIVLCGFFYPRWDAIGRRLAATYSATFVPGSTCYDPRHVGPDGLHMSATGHAVVAARLARVVQPLLFSGRRPLALSR